MSHTLKDVTADIGSKTVEQTAEQKAFLDERQTAGWIREEAGKQGFRMTRVPRRYGFAHGK